MEKKKKKEFNKDYLSAISFNTFSDISSDILSHISSETLSDISSTTLSNILSDKYFQYYFAHIY